MDPLMMMSDGINDMSAHIHNLSMMMSNGINDIYDHISLMSSTASGGNNAYIPAGQKHAEKELAIEVTPEFTEEVI